MPENSPKDGVGARLRRFGSTVSAAVGSRLGRLAQPKRFWLASGWVVLMTALLSFNLVPDKVSLSVGDTAQEEIRAHRTVEYTDRQATEQIRSEAALRIPNIYDEIPFATSDAVQAITDFFRLVDQARRNKEIKKPPGSVAQLTGKLPVPLTPASLSLLLNMPSDGLMALRSAAERQVGPAMAQELRDTPSDLPRARETVNAEVRRLPFSSAERVALAELVGGALRPNRLLNARRTERLREEERMNVAPVRRTILHGEVVAHKDDKITPDQIEQLLALGLQQPALDPSRIACLGLLLAFLVLIFSLYLREYHATAYGDFRLLCVLAGLATLSVIGVKLGVGVLGIKLSSPAVGYLNMLWIATAAMLVSALIGPHVAVALAALLSVGVGLGLDIELRFVAASFASGLAGIYAASHLRDRSSLVRMGLTVTGANVVLAVLLGGLSGDPPASLLTGIVWAVSGGIGAALLFWLGVALLERPLGVTTHVGLLELCDTNRPVLKKLLMEAPGTYHHSRVMATLCESAAEAVGADPLLVRTMAYYHDIGKTRRPQFFVENQRVENVHDRLNPSLSMLVIAAHVREGVEMARELKLPPPIVDGIREHHGTGLVAFFYHQAAGVQGPSADLEQQFRYDGPKPRTKETAILMLADGVEAASRVFVKATPAQIDELIARILQDRLKDGQLDECDLTLRDLDRISKSFSHALTAILHSRIEYPTVITATEARKALKHVSLDSQPNFRAGDRSEPPSATGSSAASG